MKIRGHPWLLFFWHTTTIGGVGSDPLQLRMAELRRRLYWMERERALCVGAPLAVFPALAILPVIAFCILEPGFPHARTAGLVVLPLLAAAIAYGIGRLSLCLRHPFDIISFFAAGSLVVLLFLMICTGVMLATLL